MQATPSPHQVSVLQLPLPLLGLHPPLPSSFLILCSLPRLWVSSRSPFPPLAGLTWSPGLTGPSDLSLKLDSAELQTLPSSVLLVPGAPPTPRDATSTRLPLLLPITHGLPTCTLSSWSLQFGDWHHHPPAAPMPILSSTSDSPARATPPPGPGPRLQFWPLESPSPCHPCTVSPKRLVHAISSLPDKGPPHTPLLAAFPVPPTHFLQPEQRIPAPFCPEDGIACSWSHWRRLLARVWNLGWAQLGLCSSTTAWSLREDGLPGPAAGI